MVKIFGIDRIQEEFWLIWVWIRARWVNVYFYLLHWLSWMTTTGKVSFTVAFCSSLVVLLLLMRTSVEFAGVDEGLLITLSCSLCSFWECVSRSTFTSKLYERNVHFWRLELLVPKLAFFLFSAAWPAWIAFLRVASRFLSRRSVRRKSLRLTIIMSFIKKSH